MVNLKKTNLTGQAIIIGLIFVVVISTIVLALVSKSLTDVKISSETEEELRTFSAAEAGLEKAFVDTTILSTGGTADWTIGNSDVKITAEKVQWDSTTAFAYPDKITQDDTRQFFLAQYDDTQPDTYYFDEANYYDGSQLDVIWGEGVPDTGSVSGFSPAVSQPSVEVTLYYHAADGSYQIKRFAFGPTSNSSQGIGFDTNITDISGDDPMQTTFGPKRFAYKYTLSFDLATGDIPLFLRVRFLFNGNNGHSLAFKPPVGLIPAPTYYPTQGYKVTSQATSTSAENPSVQRIEAFKSYPILPAIFDYALFSGSNIQKP